MTTSPQGAEPLGLTTILTGSLPLTLLTDAAPARYVVEAAFTRRVEPEETALILGQRAQDFLTARGYSNVQLTVSDRRLVIANTNLEELRDGLSRAIAELLASISEEVRTLHHQQDVRRKEESIQLQERTQALAELTNSINFEPPTEPYNDSRSVESDQEGTDRWDGEGGASQG